MARVLTGNPSVARLGARVTANRDTTAADLVRRVVDPLREFLHNEAAGGIALLLATVAALGWANSGAAASYDQFWHAELTIGTGPLAVTHDLQHWVNDGLMTLFFF